MIKQLARVSGAFAFSLVLLGLLLFLAGYPPGEALWLIVSSTWGSSTGWMMLLNRAALLILTGLAVVIPYRCGLFNIGGEGQLIGGGLIAAIIGTLPFAQAGAGHLATCLIGGTFAGALLGLIVGWLKSARQVHEVISTIMLNFIVLHLANQLVFGVLRAGEGASRTAQIAEAARLPILFQQGAVSVTAGILVALVIAVGLSVWLYQTRPGFGIRAVGSQPETAALTGRSVARTQWLGLVIGGGCAGLAGAIQTTGMSHAFYARFTGGTGFDGIAVAFLACVEPWATVPAALVLSTLHSADRILQLELGLHREVTYLLEGILIVCIALFLRKANHD